MGFFDDAWDTVKSAASTYATYANAIYTVPANYVAKNSNSPILQQAGAITRDSFSGFNTYGISPTIIGGSNDAIKSEYFNRLKGAAIGGGYAVAGAAGAGLAAQASQGKVDTGGILGLAGVDPSISSLFPNLDFSDTPGAQMNKERGEIFYEDAPQSMGLPLGGENNDKLAPILIIGGAAVLAFLYFRR